MRTHEEATRCGSPSPPAPSAPAKEAKATRSGSPAAATGCGSPSSPAGRCGSPSPPAPLPPSVMSSTQPTITFTSSKSSSTSTSLEKTRKPEETREQETKEEEDPCEALKDKEDGTLGLKKEEAFLKEGEALQKAEEASALLKTLIPRLHWDVILAGVAALGGETALGLSSALPSDSQVALRLCEEGDVETLRNLRRVLIETHIMEGHLVCPASSVRFPISNGVPNFVQDAIRRVDEEEASEVAPATNA